MSWLNRKKTEVNLIEDAYKSGFYVGHRIGKKALLSFLDSREGKIYFPGQLGRHVLNEYIRVQEEEEREISNGR